jgi:hypothetical protein
VSDLFASENISGHQEETSLVQSDKESLGSFKRPGSDNESVSSFKRFKRRPKLDLCDSSTDAASVISGDGTESEGARRSSRLTDRGGDNLNRGRKSRASSNDKQQCPDCGNFYVNLNNHKKCQKRSESVETASVAGSQQSGDENARRMQRTSLDTEEEPMDVEPAESGNNDQQRSRSRGRRANVPASKAPADAVFTDGSNAADDEYVQFVIDDCRKFGRTRKGELHENFRREVAALKKKYLSRSSAASRTHEDPLHQKLKAYHDRMLNTLSNTTTEKLSQEVADVLTNPAAVSDCDRPFVWSKPEEERLNELNVRCKELKTPREWTWAAADDTPQGTFNDIRMQWYVRKELQVRIIECPECKSNGILVGLEQIEATMCYDCVQLGRANKEEKRTKKEAWEKVRPVSKDYPKRTERGREMEDLAELFPGDKAVLAPCFAVVTIQKRFYSGRKLRQENISLVQDPAPTWCKILPRTSLKERFMVIERTMKDATKRHIVANADRVRQWLRYLFRHHKEFVRMRRDNELVFSEQAIRALESKEELAEVDDGLADEATREAEQTLNAATEQEDGLSHAELQSGFSESHVFSFDKYPDLYLKAKEVMRIRKEGKIEIVEDPTVRRPTYNVSANVCFPHLYPNSELSPMDFSDFKLGRYLLKKQSLYAHRMSSGKLQYHYAADDIHMAHQFSRLSEMTVHATVGYYLTQHPEVAHLPIDSVVRAFKEGMDDAGLLDSHLPDLTQIMTQVPHSRERWFSERLAIESISRQLGDPNVFMTVNLDVRASPDVRQLVYRLEHGKNMPRDHPFDKNTEAFTALLNKYAPQVNIYLYRKVKIFLRAFLTDVCGVPEKEPGGDWTSRDRTQNSWFWQRVEHTETRGMQHHHILVKLGNVLDTSLLGRIIHNSRVVRQEMKCGNVRPEMKEKAWEMIEMGLLASRYVVLFAQSISTASFYTQEVGVDGHDAKLVVDVEKHRDEYVKNYKAGNVTLATHPIMRQFYDKECNSNRYVEEAKVAAVSCQHHCITNSCGGDPKTGDGCRFDFPRRKLNHTVPAVLQINANQMEARVLLRRTCDRVPNLNRYLLRYLRSNHDVTVLIDAAHKMRYATKYAAKGGKYTELLDEVIEHMNKRSMDLLPPNMKQVLSHLILADCSHRAFISQQELAYKVMNLPMVRRSFPEVSIVGFYQRANLRMAVDDENTIEYSDRTQYSAYAERCRQDTRLGSGLTSSQVEAMNFNEFASTVRHRWVGEREIGSDDIEGTNKRKFRTRDVNSGHWMLTKYQKTAHTRPSTVLYTAPAIDYELVEPDKTTTQTTFFDLPTQKRNQLYRAYYELVQYVPWKNSPDETFLAADIREKLNSKETHPELGSRHSLMRLEEFFKIYQRVWNEGKVAPAGSVWHRDNQFAYTMFLVGQHNRHVQLERADNQGVFSARYEDADELVDVDVDIQAEVRDEVDEADFPSVLNFMPPDSFREIMEQKPQELSEINVAFPLQNQWQKLEELVMLDKTKRFIASPPPAPVSYEQMTPVQQWAVDLGVDMKQPILYLCGKAGSGKTTVALKICEMMRGRVQAGACTGKAASNFNGPTNHSMFGWSHDEFQNAANQIAPDSRRIQQLRTFYEGIDVFVIDEINATSAASLALLHETMTAVFNPKHRVNAEKDLLPFGGKKMIFLGDPAQLRPVMGAAIYDGSQQVSNDGSSAKSRFSRAMERTKKGQMLYAKYLLANCIVLQKGQRNVGLLGEICDRIRDGEQTEEDLRKLTCQRRRFPDWVTDHGIHYENDVCTVHNWRQLWLECSSVTPPRRLYICKATYHTTPDNQAVIDGLCCLPPRVYNYAPDVLCVSEGCEVRLVQNINVAAGLVTSATGTVVKVIYNNADVQSILDGKNCPPYCIVVEFPQFIGFLDTAESGDLRIRPFPDHPRWVPIYRKQFSVMAKDLPSWIRKKQMPKDCYRKQFPLDLSSNITAHRAQGQTLANCTVSVDLGLENPDKRLPSDIASIIYVACTRVHTLKDLFVSPIFPTIWEKIGKSDVDERRREVDKKLKSAALDFASRKGKYREMKAELAWMPDYSNNETEWAEMEAQREPPTTIRRNRLASLATFARDEFRVEFEDCDFTMVLEPVLRERHIGLDQGTNNFGMTVVEKTQGSWPKIVAAENFTDLNFPAKFQVTDVLVALAEKTDLMLWMEPANQLSQVDRVIVHLEQIDPRNRHWKQFSIDLGRLLQQRAADPTKCIVKLSSPHIHRATGPAFRLGEKIIDELKLQAPTYATVSSRSDRNPAVHPTETNSSRQHNVSDVEPDSEEDEPQQDAGRPTSDYRMKKKMSAGIFQYIVEADDEELAEMQIDVEPRVRDYWRQKIASSTNSSTLKLDDVGDALLHALDEILCGSTNFRQLIPAAPSLHNNRTIAVALFPSVTFWVVIHCMWNSFVLENFGCNEWHLEKRHFKDESTARAIRRNLHMELRKALEDYKGDPLYVQVDHIKVVVKQLTGFSKFDMSNIEAGTLTEADVESHENDLQRYHRIEQSLVRSTRQVARLSLHADSQDHRSEASGHSKHRETHERHVVLSGVDEAESRRVCEGEKRDNEGRREADVLQCSLPVGVELGKSHRDASVERFGEAEAAFDRRSDGRYYDPEKFCRLDLDRHQQERATHQSHRGEFETEAIVLENGNRREARQWNGVMIISADEAAVS